MDESSAELTRRSYEIFNAREYEAFVELVDEDVVIESRLTALEGAYRGHEGLREWWETFLGVFPDYRIEVDALEDVGDCVLVHARGAGHAMSGEVPLSDPFWHALQWRDGKVVWWRNCRTEEEAREAIAGREGT